MQVHHGTWRVRFLIHPKIKQRLVVSRIEPLDERLLGYATSGARLTRSPPCASLHPVPTTRATRHTLIRRACDAGDQAAWVEFDRIYRRFISFVLGQIGVGRDDVDDVTQQILFTLTRDLPGYDPGKGRFRAWLSAVIRHAALAHLRRQRSEQARLGVVGADLATDSLDRESDLDQRIEAEWTTYVANLAMERIRVQFQGRAIEVFELGLDGVPLEEICARTGLTTASAYTLRKRVKKRLYQEIRALINDLEP